MPTNTKSKLTAAEIENVQAEARAFIAKRVPQATAPAPTASPQHGGAREGAGRKPKALKYASQLAEAEGKIIAALPEVIEALIKAAKGDEVTPPDVSAAKYLLDRVWGKIPPQGVPIAEDDKTPIDPEEWQQEEELRRKSDAKMRELREMCL